MRQLRDHIGNKTHDKIGEFAPTHEPWDMYVERLELYFVANNMKEAKKKRAILVIVCGPVTYKLIRNLAAPQKPAKVQDLYKGENVQVLDYWGAYWNSLWGK